ncbi:hypothetical protein PFDSM3638_03155 [Pyrococcus furiosus DSM 3638]|uniref:DUF234 domain-containing protein n=2 Tax=Pyrococcus furiosus (strain ATCC 43587 / DSM 3638 / JCM 8422 / Vc1) TaxID=186497 RepID=A0A5C0XN42_PYRFU|nr:hypothetical protein PF0632 [Pyrococcus furiosus DSM 3638]MDK2869615.1 hypothetical protein [Pyrococcus sp.]QEK78333.1 hypothetical protein PFDSM3638_03155 [Pyrococcus furiosus DSM 3638]
MGFLPISLLHLVIKLLKNSLRKSSRELKDNFYDEPYIVLSELRELKTYFSILSAIAAGKRKPSEMANEVDLEGRKIHSYIETLIRLGFVERDLLVARKEKRWLYIISDPMLMSWFSLVYPKRTEIEIGAMTIDDVKEILQRIFSFRFEQVSREFLIELNRKGNLPFRFTKIGRWWHKEEEIDIVALNEKEKKSLLIEIKWKELKEREIKGILNDLELEGWDKIYGVIAKKVQKKENLWERGFLIWDLEDLDVL